MTLLVQSAHLCTDWSYFFRIAEWDFECRCSCFALLVVWLVSASSRMGFNKQMVKQSRLRSNCFIQVFQMVRTYDLNPPNLKLKDGKEAGREEDKESYHSSILSPHLIRIRKLIVSLFWSLTSPWPQGISSCSHTSLNKVKTISQLLSPHGTLQLIWHSSVFSPVRAISFKISFLGLCVHPPKRIEGLCGKGRCLPFAQCFTLKSRSHLEV